MDLQRRCHSDGQVRDLAPGTGDGKVSVSNNIWRSVASPTTTKRPTVEAGLIHCQRATVIMSNGPFAPIRIVLPISVTESVSVENTLGYLHLPVSVSVRFGYVSYIRDFQVPGRFFSDTDEPSDGIASVVTSY